jgi:hypothetical protein
VGVFALVATAQGLWIGSDTERIDRYEHHGRIAFMPLAGGTEVPEPRVGTLPGDLFRLAWNGAVTRSALTGTATGPSSTVATGTDWSTVRGAFAVNGRLYTGHADGTMTVRSFDGTTAGLATPLALNGLTSTQFPVSRITGMFLWNGRLYYTLSADPRLYYRWFTPQSGTIGADTFVASGAGDGRNWSTVTGMTMASGRLTYATTGTLSTVDFSGGLRAGPATALSGPGRRRPLLAVPRPVRPQPGRLTGPRVRYPALHHAPVAQGTEQLSPKQQVAGSSPARGTRHPWSQVRRAREVASRGRRPRPRRCTALNEPNNARGSSIARWSLGCAQCQLPRKRNSGGENSKPLASIYRSIGELGRSPQISRLFEAGWCFT